LNSLEYQITHEKVTSIALFQSNNVNKDFYWCCK